MIVLIKNSPATSEGRRGLKIARDSSADIVLLQNGVYFAINEMLDGFCGTAYAVEEDLKMRGLADIKRGIKKIGWPELIDLMANEERVVGMF
ncbi:MAG: hypothetical protein GXO99_01400 [Nitrospirae bacterium]|nr:hypothetical protein [Nitrospirota bacterium]